MRFGDKLKSLREKKKLTQEDVANRVGISRRAYIAYEQNESRPRKRETYNKLAEILNCNVNYLLIDDSAAIAGATAAVSALGIALGSTIMTPVGLAAALGVFIGRNKIVNKDVPEESLSYNNDMLLQYERKQKKFKATALGIIYGALVRKDIKFRHGDIKTLDSLGGRPDEFVVISDAEISEWWFSFWAKDSELDDHVIISARDRADVMFSRFVTAVEESKRQISIVVDDEELFNALCELKCHNSYKGYMSAILVDTDEVRIVKEEVLSYYSDNIIDSIISVL